MKNQFGTTDMIGETRPGNKVETASGRERTRISPGFLPAPGCEPDGGGPPSQGPVANAKSRDGPAAKQNPSLHALDASRAWQLAQKRRHPDRSAAGAVEIGEGIEADPEPALASFEEELQAVALEAQTSPETQRGLGAGLTHEPESPVRIFRTPLIFHRV